MGCAVGDALGAPLEGRSREQIATIPGIADGFRPFRHKKDVEFPLGQYTDDTQLTLAIAKSLLTCGRVDPVDIAAEFVKLWESNEIVGAGPVAHRAVRRLMEGIHWEDAAAADDLPWNGAAMRIAPVGLWHFDDADQLVRDVELASFVTHRHPLAVDGAVAIATAVAYVATWGDIDTASFLDAVRGSVADRSPALADRIGELHEWLPLTEAAALAAIVADEGRDKGRGFGVPATAEPTVLASLYVFLKSPDDYMATVGRALRVGGDVDTVAAIAGAISGARNGLDAIPANLVAGVKDSAEILDLGAKLFACRFADAA